MTGKMDLTREHKQFGGMNRFYTHESKACNGPMNFAVYLPPAAVGLSPSRKFPVLYWLSGLTCTEEIFMTEGQVQAYASQHEVIIIVPDTSPRRTGIPGEDDRYDLGSGASFYVDATTPKWKPHYQMDTYITQELREVVESELPIDQNQRGIFGHSMGGHGALVLGLRNPELYHSISAFAPIGAPMKAPWGILAFSEYLGTDQKAWEGYDACHLLRRVSASGNLKNLAPLLVDQGSDDEFFEKELFTEDLKSAIKETGYPGKVRGQGGYDHSYFFISSFMEEHILFHLKNFQSAAKA
ncbi:MAG: S-formylglutathione hydrolase [Cryobacterium sp.]|nr:S-formylglutathione hydrolase [Oligoflexia bacterium]